MYGTVAKLTVKPGQVDALKKLMATAQSHPGAVAVYLYQMDEDPNVLYMATVFSSRDAYFANADRPEMNAEFEKMMQFLVGEPEWHDGEVEKVE
jgi:quinol monooxygenase YgiN